MILDRAAFLESCDERVAFLYRYWLELHPAPGMLPGRKHFDPLDVARLLPWLWLVDVHRQPLRFKYRLIGTGVVEAMGRDKTGHWLDEAHEDFVTSRAYPKFIASCDRRECTYYKGRPMFVIKKDYVTVETLGLPMARDGTSVDMLVFLTLFDMHGAARKSSHANDRG